LLIAVGREPSFSKLNLEKAGVRESNNEIIIDEYLRTSKKHIYAAGDCVSSFKFTHIAGYQGYVAVRNALLPFKSKGLPELISWTTFTDPEVSFGGRVKFLDAIVNDELETQILEYNETDRARTDNQNEGFIKIYSLPNGKVAGASIVGSRAGELIHELLVAQLSKTKLSKVATLVHSYPTYSMGIMQLSGNILERSIFESKLGRILKKLVKIHSILS